MYLESKKLLFIHIPKTGGTSIYQTLSTGFGEDYTQSPVPAINEGLQSLTFGQRNHITLQQYIDFSIISKEDLPNIFKFAVIRDPIDRAISIFLYLKRISFISKDMDIDYFFTNWLPDTLNNKNSSLYYFIIPQHDFVSLDNTVMVDKLLVFKSLEQDFRTIASRFNIPDGLDRLNVSPRSEHVEVSNAKNNKKYQDICKDLYFKDYNLIAENNDTFY